MSSSLQDIFSQAQPQQASNFGPQFDYTKAIQGEGIPPLQLPNGGPLPQFRQPVTNDSGGGQVHRLPAQLSELFGQTAQNMAIGPQFPGGDVRRNSASIRRPVF